VSASSPALKDVDALKKRAEGPSSLWLWAALLLLFFKRR